MATAHVEWEDGSTSNLDQYESYLINTSPVELKITPDILAMLNRKFGYPDKNGAML